MTYYCLACKRLTPAYDLWPDHTCVTCSASFDELMDKDTRY